MYLNLNRFFLFLDSSCTVTIVNGTSLDCFTFLKPIYFSCVYSKEKKIEIQKINKT